MFAWDRIVLNHEPYPYAWVDNFIDPDVFSELNADFPTQNDFHNSREIMGGRFNLIRGNPDFHEFMKTSKSWNRLFRHMNSKGFQNQLLRLFQPGIAQNAMNIDPFSSPFVDYEEPAGTASTTQAAASQAHPTEPDSGSTYLTFDIAKAQNGYHRGPHLDARYKLIAMLIFFNGREDFGGEGGVFAIHHTDQDKAKAERFIEDDIVTNSIEIEPKKNRACFFLNTPNAYHSVNHLINANNERQFLYGSLAISGMKDIWK